MNWAGAKVSLPAAWWWRPRRWLGLAIAAGGAAALVLSLWQALRAFDGGVAYALLGGSFAALATALGALPVLACTAPSPRWRNAMIGFGAGVMFAASFFSLILPGLAAARALGATAGLASLQVLAGVVLGAAVLHAFDRRVRRRSRSVAHDSATCTSLDASTLALRRVWLFVAAITLHNFPEGLAIGVAFAGSDFAGATALAAGISIQDIPEGLAVALALHSVGYDRVRAVALGALSGLFEPIAAVSGALVVALSAGLLPWGLAFAAGAMLYVIALHMIPEIWKNEHRAPASIAFAGGFLLMTVLDLKLG